MPYARFSPTFFIRSRIKYRNFEDYEKKFHFFNLALTLGLCLLIWQPLTFALVWLIRLSHLLLQSLEKLHAFVMLTPPPQTTNVLLTIRPRPPTTPSFQSANPAKLGDTDGSKLKSVMYFPPRIIRWGAERSRWKKNISNDTLVIFSLLIFCYHF